MDLENINIYDTVSDISNLPKTTFFSSKVQTLKDKIQPILDDFQKYFVFNKLNPEYTEYQQIFANIKSNISSISSELFMLINGIESKTDEINKGWDGRVNDGSQIAQNDVYVWKIVVNDMGGNEHKYEGIVTLLK